MNEVLPDLETALSNALPALEHANDVFAATWIGHGLYELYWTFGTIGGLVVIGTGCIVVMIGLMKLIDIYALHIKEADLADLEQNLYAWYCELVARELYVSRRPVSITWTLQPVEVALKLA